MQETRIHRGRTRTFAEGIRDWSSKRRRYNNLRADILRLIQARGWSPEEVKHWLNTPTPALRAHNLKANPPRSPKQLLNPHSIAILHKWAKRVLR